MPTTIEVKVLDEYEVWRQALELERWTTSGQDPKRALRELIAREYVTPKKLRERYLHQPKDA